MKSVISDSKYQFSKERFVLDKNMPDYSQHPAIQEKLALAKATLDKVGLPKFNNTKK